MDGKHEEFWRQGDFGYIKKEVDSMMTLCKPQAKVNPLVNSVCLSPSISYMHKGVGVLVHKYTIHGVLMGPGCDMLVGGFGSYLFSFYTEFPSGRASCFSCLSVCLPH